MIRRFRPFRCALIAASAGALLILTPSLRAQEPGKTDAPAQPGDRGASGSGERMRGALTESMRRQLERARERTQRLERALKLLEEGKPLAEVRAVFPDLGPGLGMGEPNTDRMGGMGVALRQLDQLDQPLPEGPGRGPRPEAGAEGGGGRELSTSEEQFIEEFLRSSAPGMIDRFAELRRRDPEEARRKFAQMFPRVRFLYQMRDRDPEMYQLRLADIRHSREALEAARAVARMDSGKTDQSEDRQQRVDELRAALEQQYDVRGRILRREMDKMRERLEEGDREISRRGEARDRVVAQFVDSMVRQEIERLSRPPRGERSDRQRGEPRREAPEQGERP